MEYMEDWIEERDIVSIKITHQPTSVGFSRKTWNGYDYDSVDGNIGNIDILFKRIHSIHKIKEIRLTGTINPGNVGIGDYFSSVNISLNCKGLVNIDCEDCLDLEDLQPLIEVGVPKELVKEIYSHPSMDLDRYSVEISR